MRAGLPRWWVEVVVGGIGFGLYQLVQALVTGSPASAVGRARSLWQLEGTLRLDPESALNRLLAAHPGWVTLTAWYYTVLHFAVTLLVLCWLWIARRAQYRPLRTAFVLASLAGLLVYWLLPLAPPRLAVPGFVDTTHLGALSAAPHATWPESLANPYAAMPSLHVAWAVWVALAVSVACRSRWRLLAWAYPMVTALVVIATGNHFVADVVAGAALTGCAWWLATRRSLLMTLRPGRAALAAPAAAGRGSPADRDPGE